MTILKNCILFLSDLIDQSDLLIVKTPNIALERIAYWPVVDIRLLASKQVKYWMISQYTGFRWNNMAKWLNKLIDLYKSWISVKTQVQFFLLVSY